MDVNKDTNSKIHDQVILFITLLLLWVMLNGSISSETLMVGVLVAFLITLLFQKSLSFFTEFRFTKAAIIAGIKYYGYFFKELVISNFRLAKIVVSPSLPINPGIVKVRTKLKTKMGRLMLANSISLTPGTLTVEIRDEWIYVHWVTVETADLEKATREIVDGFESYLEVMYG